MEEIGLFFILMCVCEIVMDIESLGVLFYWESGKILSGNEFLVLLLYIRLNNCFNGLFFLC